ncbi:adhesive plaque matrix protein-like [Maniola hyperantus]|uniref:adhesive plaque matrix protein-like n=1 Tax=Aphantopus hyperantus TaxID=2795564 RepID=UPI001568A5A3|nr:uncharacterized protein LOC117989759 [Maniola hyperantus]
MRWLSMVLFCLVLSTTTANPDPKKYKKESVEKDKKSETLTTDEKIFLREVEEKYGVKSDIPVDNQNEEDEKSVEKNYKDTTPGDKKALPAVIAIEIVNDTDSQFKGKRTIDANLGYGYKTNNGYSYSYFGKSNQNKGKFVIYPYSQEDPPAYNSPENKYSSSTNGKYSSFQSTRTNVEIQPSQAYELVPVKEEKPSYEYKKPAIEFKTPSIDYSGERTAQTLYTTYNGQELSGLSGQFPTVMPNYFVDPSQLLQNPHFQSAGLTQDHLRSQGSYLNQNQRIVPVLVLRVPSSYLRNPTAELYANLPTNYPLSQHLNTVNLQSLVNQYFKTNGYSFAPNTYQSPASSPESGPQHYSHPYVKPTYTEADYSGVQYSAVKPVMARYPATYTQQKYLLTQPQSVYQNPTQQQPQSVYQNPTPQQYEYQYQYVPQTEVKMQTYYIQPQYQQSLQETAVPESYQNQQSVVEQQSNVDDSVSTGEYTPQYTSGQEGKETVEYEPQNVSEPTAQLDVSQYVSASPDSANYAVNNENTDYSKQQVSAEYPSVALPSYTSQSEYYATKSAQKNTVSVYPSNLIHTEQYQEPAAPEGAAQGYSYSNQNTEDSGKSFVISENYPSKDHTIATVLPYTYKSSRRPTQTSIQAVSYVTPMPTSKYQTQYRIMVPKTVLRDPNSEKVSYVNSHSLPMHYTQIGNYADSSSESEYAAGSQYVSSVASKPSYTRNYHPKRMARPDSKTEASSARVSAKKTNERGERKKLS